MTKAAFDNDKYLQMQSAHIRERIAQFGGKLYLEFGGKLYDDNHASRVLPGFQPDSKLRMLLQLKEQVEMVIAINADDIEKNKVRGDLGITYDRDVIRLIDIFRGFGLYVSSVVLTRFHEQALAKAFQSRLEGLGIRVYHHFEIPGYPSDTGYIVSPDGFGKNDYIETTRSLVVVTAPGPGSGKLATCLSQLYHEHIRGNTAGYAKFETFPIWNVPLNHPVNLAYEGCLMIRPCSLFSSASTFIARSNGLDLMTDFMAVLYVSVLLPSGSAHCWCFMPQSSSCCLSSMLFGTIMCTILSV